MMVMLITTDNDGVGDDDEYIVSAVPGDAISTRDTSLVFSHYRHGIGTEQLMFWCGRKLIVLI